MDAGHFAAMDRFAQADTAQAELAIHAVDASAPVAAALDARAELRRALGFDDKGATGHMRKCGLTVGFSLDLEWEAECGIEGESVIHGAGVGRERNLETKVGSVLGRLGKNG